MNLFEQLSRAAKLTGHKTKVLASLPPGVKVMRWEEDGSALLSNGWRVDAETGKLSRPDPFRGRGHERRHKGYV